MEAPRTKRASAGWAIFAHGEGAALYSCTHSFASRAVSLWESLPDSNPCTGEMLFISSWFTPELQEEKQAISPQSALWALTG